MKTKKLYKTRIAFLLILVLMSTTGCERDISGDAVEASFSSNPEVFIDGFSSGLEYLPFGGSRLDAFTVDTETRFEGTAAMRFDVPNVGDPGGAFAGAIFPDNSGRDLSGYDALTFYAKATQAGTINEIGFGNDFGENKYLTVLNNLTLTTNWRKYTIPIPDPSKLTFEKGLFWYAEGPEAGSGYTFWIDELRYENLGTIAQPRPKILNGQDQVQQTFIGSQLTIGGLTQTYNLASGLDRTVNAAAGYFEFESSNTSVAIVNNLGQVSIVGSGTAIVTASLGSEDAEGSLTLISLGEFTQAPVPTRDPENVISIFSDSYTNVPVDYYNGFFNGDGQTTQGGAPPTNFGGGEVINYTNLNFVGIGTFLNVPTIDASQMTHIHVDINVQEALDSGDQLTLQLLNGVQTSNELSGSVVLNSTQLTTDDWESFDIPLGSFGLSARDALGLLFFNSTNSSNVATISNIYVDNIYYYKEVVEPSPNVDDSNATQVALPIGFESTSLTYDIGVFAGADSAVIPNPDQSGINGTSTVLRTIKTTGADFFAGTTLELDAPVDFSTSQLFRMKVWSPKTGIPVRIKLENSANSSQFIELDANTTTTNEWEELEWDFSGTNFNIASLDRVVIFFEFVDGLSGDGSTYYCDDLKILN